MSVVSVYVKCGFLFRHNKVVRTNEQDFPAIGASNFFEVIELIDVPAILMTSNGRFSFSLCLEGDFTVFKGCEVSNERFLVAFHVLRLLYLIIQLA